MLHSKICVLLMVAGDVSLSGLNSGTYRVQLCDGWVGCSDTDEYIGFNNKTCSAGVPPKSKTYGNTVGPVLRDYKESRLWKSWYVDVLSKSALRAVVTLRNYYGGSGTVRCVDHYIADYSEKKDACKESEWADRVHLHKDRVKWTLKPVTGTECFNVINAEKPSGCLRYLSAQTNCNNRYLHLTGSDTGSGLERWKFVKIGEVPEPPLIGSTCASTGPNNCEDCCKGKFAKNDGSFLEDPSCLDEERYPQCTFDLVPPPVGSTCISTGPACDECCKNKKEQGTIADDPTCLDKTKYPQC